MAISRMWFMFIWSLLDMNMFYIYHQLRAKRLLMLFKDVPLRTIKRLCSAIVPFWLSMEHLWTALTSFWCWEYTPKYGYMSDHIVNRKESTALYSLLILLFKLYSKIESQKGAITIQTCSVESQKDAIPTDFVQW